jgi:flavin-dependent dehydrogenase
MYDLIVVGGGPAGTSAAITAARAGARVALFERGRFPRHKVCGEFVSAESLALLRDLLAERYRTLLDDSLRIPRARLFLEGRVLETSVNPAAASIARFDLDLALAESAAAMGVEIRFQSTVKEICGTGPFHTITSTGEFEARAIINASGRWSNLNSMAGANAPREKWLGVKGHFAEASPENSVDLYFFEGGYCGVQPVNMSDGGNGSGRVNACAVVRADVALTLEEIFALNPELYRRSRQWQGLSEPVSTSPLIFRKPAMEKDGVLSAGDAAAFVDPFVGDGISLALRSGSLAAECLSAWLRGESSLAAVGKKYCEAYGKRFGSVFRTSSKLRRLLRMPRVVRRPLVSMLAHTPGVTEFLVTRTR